MAASRTPKRPRRERLGVAQASSSQAGASGNASAGEPRNPHSRAGPGVSPFSRRDALPFLVLGLMVAVSYFPALSGGFIWDDVIFTEEPVVREASGLRSIWFSPSDIKKEGHYWPIVYTSFWLEHKLWGLAPLGYHLVNVVLHLVNSVLVWRLLLRLAVPGAWVAAAVFAVHPLHVESVAWIIERKDLLSALFYLTAVLTWIRFVETPAWGRYVLSLALFTAGMLSKTVVVTLPAALLIWHGWKRERVTSTDLLRLAPFFAVGLGITLGDLSFYTSREPLSLGYSLVERALIAARALWFYAGKLLWPTDLAVIYPLWDIRAGDPLAWAWVLGAAALAALLWFGRRWFGPGPLAGALFFAVTLSPVLGFVDYGYMQFAFVADRFQYLAGIGVMAVLIGGAAAGAARLPRAVRMGTPYLVAAVLVILGAMTWRHAGIYRDEIAFFGHIVSHNPDARDAYLNLAHALTTADRPAEALAAARSAVEKRPDSASAYSNLGLALLKLERLDEAEKILHRGLELDPRHRNARQNLAEVMRKQKRHEEAVEAYRRVIKRDRRYARAYAGLGDSLYHLQRYDEAVASMSTAISLEPNSSINGTLHVLLGLALQKLDRLEAAAEHFHRALELDPADARPLVSLAGLRTEQGRSEEANEYLDRARKLNPRDPATLQNAGEALRKQKRYAEAIEAYRAVLDIDPEYALAHAGLGNTLFQMKRYQEALASVTRAVTLVPDLRIAGSLHVIAGRALQELGRPGEAVEQYERALEINPRNTQAVDRFAMMRFGQKHYQEALRLYRTLVELQPDSAQSHSNLGATLYHLNRLDDARRSFERALALDPALKTAQAGLKEARRRMKLRKEQ